MYGSIGEALNFVRCCFVARLYTQLFLFFVNSNFLLQLRCTFGIGLVVEGFPVKYNKKTEGFPVKYNKKTLRKNVVSVNFWQNKSSRSSP